MITKQLKHAVLRHNKYDFPCALFHYRGRLRGSGREFAV
jgi:hypothetical protein